MEEQETNEYRWRTVPINIFKRGVMFFIGPKDSLISELKKNFNGYAEEVERLIKEENLTECDALGYTFKTLPDAIVWCPKEPSASTAIHELIHCIYNILKQVEIPMTDDTEELVAYMTEYLTDEFLPWLEKKTKTEKCE